MTRNCREKKCSPVVFVSNSNCCEKRRHQKQIRVNRTVFVDQQFGNDLTGKRTYMGKPFQTILAGLLSAQDGDTIWVRASNLPTSGPYVQDIILPMPNIPTSIKFYLEPDAVLQPSTLALFQVSGTFDLEVDGNGTLSGNGLIILQTNGDFTGNVILKATTYQGLSFVGSSGSAIAKDVVAPVKTKKERRQLAKDLHSKVPSLLRAPPSGHYLFTLNSIGGVIKI